MTSSPEVSCDIFHVQSTPFILHLTASLPWGKKREPIANEGYASFPSLIKSGKESFQSMEDLDSKNGISFALLTSEGLH